MSTAYSPPERKTEYVAYAAQPVRQGNSETGEAVDFRPSIFMREVPSVLVKSFEVKSGEYFGETTTWGYVVFDASSLGIEKFVKDFGATVEAGSAAAALLERAHKEQKPVDVAIETVRRPKNKSTGDSISPLTYIHDLRGADRDGQRGNSNQTGDTTKNIVVGVGAAGHPETFVLTNEVKTDPAEWVALRSNREHTLPPNGWRIHEGGIIPTGTGATGGAAVDVDDLVARVVAAVKPIMAGNTGSRPRPTQRDGFAVEAKQWEPWNSDGRVNLGGYLLGKERAVFDEAFTMVGAADPSLSAAARIEKAWALVPVLHWMADTVQATTYGPGAKPNRCATSHFEASKWVQYVYTTFAEHDAKYALTKEALSDVAAQQTWAKAVVEVAIGLYRQAAVNVEAHLTGGQQAPAEQQPKAPAPAAPAEQPKAAAKAAPKAAPKATPKATATEETAPLDEWATTAANPALMERYEALLAGVQQAAHPERFHPLLEQEFGSWQMREIEHDAFDKALSAWESKPQAFIDAAHAAWQAKAKKA